MALLTVGVRDASEVRRAALTWVEARTGVGNSWRIARYLRPMSHTEATAPAMSRAEMQMRYGLMTRADRASIRRYNPIRLGGFHVRIRGIDNPSDNTFSSPVTYWAGIVDRETFEVLGSDNGRSGDQAFSAFGPEWFLDRGILRGSLWSDGEGGAAQTDIPLEFNKRGAWGNVIGNRSAEMVDGNYVMARSGVQWTAGDILRYTLRQASIPGGLGWSIGGELGPLENYTPIMNADGLSAWDVIKRLIDRRRGMGCRVLWDGGDTALLDVFSVSHVASQAAGYELVPNSRRVDINLENIGIAGTASMEIDRQPVAGSIVVRGGAFRVAFTASASAGYQNLRAGWSSEAEEAYRNAGSEIAGFADAPEAAQGEIADIERSFRTDWEAVYSRFEIDPAWTWEWEERIINVEFVNWAQSALVMRTREEVLPASIVQPELDDSAGILTDTAQTTVETQRSFERHCCMFRGYSYLTDPPTRLTTAEGDEDEPAPPLVFMRGSSQVPSGRVLSRWYQGDRPGYPTWPAVTVRIDEKSLAIWLEATPPHAIALGSYVPGTNGTATSTDPVVNWGDSLLTVAVETHRRVEVTVPGSPNSDRTVLIELPDAELWWVTPGTVVGIKGDGTPARAGEEGIITRDDRPRLRALAALASIWHGRDRATLRLSERGLGGVASPGSMIGNLSGAARRVVSNSVVTERTVNYERQETTISSGYSELDWSSNISGAGAGRSGSVLGSGRGTTDPVTHGQMKDYLADVPVRTARGGLGSAGGGGDDTVTIGVITGYLGYASSEGS